MAENKTVLFELSDGVARITLNRPEAANSLNLDLAAGFGEAVRRSGSEPGVRAILLSGAGRMFCAGGDLKSFSSQPEGKLPQFLDQVTALLHNAIARLSRLDAPTVAAVHGSAAGAGMSLACACDFVFAAESARFTMAYTRAGLTPDGSSTYFLPRIVGFRKALELSILNTVLSAQEAQQLGIVTRVVPDLELIDQTTRFARQLAEGPTRAFGGVKRLLRESATNTLEAQMARETEMICQASETHDGREGIGAFVAKRAPKFSGR